MNEVTVILWRHAPTPDNAAGRLQGRSDTPAGESGLLLGSAAAGLILKKYGVPTRIFSSPLQRASATAQLLADAALAYQPESNLQVGEFGPTTVEVEIEDGINQRSYGVWEGMTLAEVHRHHPEELAIRNAGGDPDIPGWEAGHAVGKRVAEAITMRCMQTIKESQESVIPPVLVFTSHGSAIGTGVRNLLGVPEHEQLLGHLAHANWVELRFRTGAWTIERFNYGPS
ncbi:histidine phosphatase family protein [Jonesiaceae bacterium BS-20]|uniref:Histidine phosphatase family protein n=1 Tax=Jonesiaceae bacterium BS-20 TaxID=3120821 RepID=A0AAU7DTE7_9MICO